MPGQLASGWHDGALSHVETSGQVGELSQVGEPGIVARESQTQESTLNGMAAESAVSQATNSHFRHMAS
jgi:hypothetical protein